MKTILVPVDFSATSTNALKYAIELVKDIEVGRIILLKNFYKSVYEQLLPSIDFVQLSDEDILQERNLINQQLKELTDSMLKKCHPSIQIEVRMSELPLLRAIHRLIAEEHPDLLIAGSDSIHQQTKTYIGEQIISIAKTSPIPVLIIPGETTYKKIKHTVVPCDFNAVSRLSVLKSLHSPLNWIHPDLLVLNIDPQQKHVSHEIEHEEALNNLVKGFNYSVHYSSDKNIVSGILKFAAEQHAQMITALPGQYSFFYKFTHSSTTEALAMNAQQPILILK